MSRGWDRGGALAGDKSSNRLICGTPPGPGSGAGAGAGGGIGSGISGLFKPNVFCGSVLDETPPVIDIGLSDHSFEVWSCWKFTAVSGDTLRETATGFLELDATSGYSYPVAIHQQEAAQEFLMLFFNGIGGDVAVPGPWTHYCVNCDRSGNMTAYANGTLLGTWAIVAEAAEDFDVTRFYPLVTQRRDQAIWNGDWTDWTTFSHVRVVVGPVAAHMRLLTAAEIQNSVLGKRVQNFGAPNTVVALDWRNIERIDGNPITWDFDPTHVLDGIRAGMGSRVMGIPVSATGEVRIPDLSGSDNHWNLPSALVYDIGDTERGLATFSSDPFWTTS